MSLSSLLAQARPVIASRFMQATRRSPNLTECILFFSLSDGIERAHIFRGSGTDFQRAWQDGVHRCQSEATRQKLVVKWLRIDWVTDVEMLSWERLSKRLANTKRNYFRFGLSLDAQLRHAFLEPELGANAMLYPGAEIAEAKLNEKNFTARAQRRFGKKLEPDFSPESPVWVFSHEGAFFTDDPALAKLPNGGPAAPNGVWLLGPSNTRASWQDSACLNAGHRQIETLQPDQVFALIDSSASFLARQVKKDGKFIYGHFPCFGRNIATYNTLRHASSLYSMLEGWELTQDKTLLDAIHRALNYLVNTLIRRYPQPDGGTLAFNVDINGEIKLGANAVSLLALVKYDELTGDNQYRPLMEQLALGIQHMQDAATGKFVHVLNSEDLSVKEVFRIVYYDGEAAFGLMRLYGLTRDVRWLAVVERAFEHFLQTNHWKHHDHWLSYCANELTLYKPEEKYFRFGVQNIAGFLDFILKRETTYPTLLELSMAFEAMLTRIQQEHPHMVHVLEGLDIDKFHRALHHRAHYLLNGFFWPELAMYFAKPATIVGSFFIRHHAFRVRIDDIEHYLSGYVAYWKLLRRRDAHEPPHNDSEGTPATKPFTQNEPNMAPSVHLLKKFDPAQLFRLFVDGRFHQKYDGWVGYEAGERGSVQALLNGFCHMMDNFDLREGLKSTYLLDLHKICMMGVQTQNLKSSPGDLRFLNAGMPFFAKTTTLENLHEILEMRRGDGTAVFNTKGYDKPAEELNAEELYRVIQRQGRLNYRNWYPNLSEDEQLALQKKSGLQKFYEVKHRVQMQFAKRVDEIVERFNRTMKIAQDDEQRLRAIALVIRELELLHPFPDGNCRTFACVLLTQLLLNYGFTPALLRNPNLDGEMSLDQWIGEIRHGMKQFMILLETPAARVYNYSIEDASAENRARFAEMSKELVRRIQEFSLPGPSVEQAVEARKAASSPELFLTPERLQAYTGGQWLRPCPPELRFTGVGTYNTYRAGNVYFAMELTDWEKKGESVRERLAGILRQQQRVLVLDRKEYADGWNIPVLLVDDTRAAFKRVAVKVRQELDPWTVLVTGTEGKTGAKVELQHLLNFQIPTHAVINSANTEIPVLRSLAGLEAKHRVEINEVSVGSDEDYRVERAKLVNPDLCLFTNIGPNHMDMHKTIENLLHAKSSVVEGLRNGGLCIVNSANQYYEGLVAAIHRRRPGVSIISYGTRDVDAGQLISQRFDTEQFGWHVEARIDDQSLNYFLPIPQQHAPLASVGVLLTIKRSGFDEQRAATDYASLKPYETMGRLVRLPKDGGEVLFYDQSRRGGISGMRSAFADLRNFRVKGRVVALVGGISVLRDSDWTREAHHQLAALINDSPIDRLYTTGNYIEYVHESLKRPPVLSSNDLDELAVRLVSELKPGDLLFIIGSAYLYLGRVAERVEGILRGRQAPPAVILGNRPHAVAYRMLKVFEDIAKGVGEFRAAASNGVMHTDFRAVQAEFKNLAGYRAHLLERFFDGMADALSARLPVMCVDEELAGGAFGRHVTERTFCINWYNNLQPESKLPKKNCFGSFFDFGHPEYLLHVEVATVRLHVGLVCCRRTAGELVPEPMSADQFSRLLLEIPALSDTALAHRKWGPGWASIDLGDFIDVSNPTIFINLMDFASSSLFREKVVPFLDILAGVTGNRASERSNDHSQETDDHA